FATYGSDGDLQATRIGGARRDRTADILLAKQALSQLSYGPIYSGLFTQISNETSIASAKTVVGPGRLELPTTRSSGVRSNHLSYGPSSSEAAGQVRLRTLKRNTSLVKKEKRRRRSSAVLTGFD